MNDRDQARAEVFASVSTSSRAEIAMLLDHRPDLVRRALGMEQRDAVLGIPVRTSGEFTARVWVEPPTDQEPGAET